jgi:hypothetical protein
MHEGMQRSNTEATGFMVQTIDGRMEEEPPTHLTSLVLTACAWVNTCHP